MNEVDFGDSCDSVPLRNDGEVGGHKGEVSNTTGGGTLVFDDYQVGAIV